MLGIMSETLITSLKRLHGKNLQEKKNNLQKCKSLRKTFLLFIQNLKIEH